VSLLSSCCGKKIPLIDIHRQMQVAHGDKCVDVSIVDAGYGNLSKQLGEATGYGRKKKNFFNDGIQKLVKRW
jgi:hypothetical protein